MHVGRTVTGKRGLKQRLFNHLHGRSSFVIQSFAGSGAKLRGKFSFRYVLVPNNRLRALLEAYAIGRLCPRHLGVGEPVME